MQSKLKFQQPVKLKVDGVPRDVLSFIQILENYCKLVKTSQLMHHPEDDRSHIYLLVTEVEL